MFRSTPPIGVDIGSHTVKVCQLRRLGNGFELERFGVADIYPSGEPPSDPRLRQEAKAQALKTALAASGIKARQSVSAVCGESIIVRYLQLPEMPEDELKKALQWEAEEYIPFRLSEVNIDSMILGRAHDGDRGKMDVLLVSAKKDLIESHVSVIRAAGLEPRVVEVDSFAFLNCFEFNHNPAAEECAALVNIGGDITSMNIYSGGTSRFSRDIPIGGETMTTAIKARLGCTTKQAELHKINHGAPMGRPREDLDKTQTLSSTLADNIRGTVEEMTGAAGSDSTQDGNVDKAIQGVLASLFSEVRRSIEFFENQYRGSSVTRVVLGGGTAMLRNLPECFEQDLHLPVETIDPLRQVQIAPRCPNADQIKASRHQWGVGIGLGIRGLAA